MASLKEMVTDVKEQVQMNQKILETFMAKMDARQERIERFMAHDTVDKSSMTEESGGEGSLLKRKATDEETRILETTEIGNDRSKFKKVGMLIFLGPNPESWLFRAERYFEIHKSSDYEKLIVSVISFDGIALSWYWWNDH